MNTDSVHDHPLLHGLPPDVVGKILDDADALQSKPSKWLEETKESGIPLGRLSELAGFTAQYAGNIKNGYPISKDGAISLAATKWYINESPTPPPLNTKRVVTMCPRTPEIEARCNAIMNEYRRGYRKVVGVQNV